MTNYKQKIDQLQLFTETTKRIENFIQTLDNRYQINPQLLQQITQFIENSGCQRIDFANFKHPALGVSLSTGVLINNMLLNHPLNFAIFVIFHEIAHQYQFKKYGAETMYSLYTQNISIDQAAKQMQRIEIIADAYAVKKTKQLQKQGLLSPGAIRGMYQQTPLSHFQQMIQHLLKEMKTKNIGTTPEQISEYFYNSVKATNYDAGILYTKN